jgi:hypothetical protein
MICFSLLFEVIPHVFITWGKRESKEGILFLSAQDYCVRSKRPLGKTILQMQCLKKEGWNFKTIPFFDAHEARATFTEIFGEPSPTIDEIREEKNTEIFGESSPAIDEIEEEKNI